MQLECNPVIRERLSSLNFRIGVVTFIYGCMERTKRVDSVEQETCEDRSTFSQTQKYLFKKYMRPFLSAKRLSEVINIIDNNYNI